jgi:hypothetical protein
MLPKPRIRGSKEEHRLKAVAGSDGRRTLASLSTFEKEVLPSYELIVTTSDGNYAIQQCLSRSIEEITDTW